MLKHYVMVKKKPETDEATVSEIIARLEALVGQIPGLLHLRCYHNLPSERPIAYTFLLDSTLDTVERLPEYLNHPAHTAVTEWMAPFLESRALVDYELPADSPGALQID